MVANSDIMERIRQHLSDSPINIDAVIRDLGIRSVPDANLPPLISGEIRRDRDRYVISSAAGEPEVRQRFTRAHELGHYVLHRSLLGDGTDDNKKYRSTPEGNLYNTSIDDFHERQANSFAASILMPEHLLRKDVDWFKKLSELAGHYGVSRSAMRWRLKNLDLLGMVEDDG